MELKNSVTMQNLMTAFSGEAQARSKYDFFSEKARECKNAQNHRRRKDKSRRSNPKGVFHKKHLA